MADQDDFWEMTDEQAQRLAAQLRAQTMHRQRWLGWMVAARVIVAMLALVAFAVIALLHIH
jgi:hypothetical protein